MDQRRFAARVRCWPFILMLALLLGAATPTWAQETADGAEANGPTQAQLDLNDRAVENIVEENYARAVAQLEEAVLRGEFNILYLNLGRAYQKLGKCAKAREALAKAKSAPPVDEPPAHLVAKKADQYLDEIAKACDEVAPGDSRRVADTEESAPEDANTDQSGQSDGSTSVDDGVAQNHAPARPGSRERNPNLFYLEFGGHGGVPTLNYERFFLFDYDLFGAELDLGAGIGVGHSEGEINYGLWTDQGTLTSVPLFVSATFLGETHSLLVQTGVAIVSAEFTRTGVLGNTVEENAERKGGFPFFQVGYQLHLDGGFLLRASLTGARYTGAIPGLTLGWSF